MAIRTAPASGSKKSPAEGSAGCCEPRTLCNRDGFKYLPPTRRAALFGFFQAHVELTRALDAELMARHSVPLTTYEVLNRLAHADDGQLRMSRLAELSPLSLSRVSRVVDELARRELVERRECAADRRVSYVSLTKAGRKLVLDAQETFFDVVEERFLGRLETEELEVLAAVFGRLAGGGEGCEKALTSR